MTIVINIFIGLGILVGIFILYLLIVALIPGISVPKQPLGKVKQSSQEADVKSPASRKDVSFKVNGTSMSAWLYLPENVSAPVPCIIMGNGFGGTKDLVMEPYALRFQEAGFAVLMIDYRHFGNSGGEPRQLIWIPYQLQDYRAGIEYARDLKEIDPEKIALWGTSFSGGHVIVIAAKDRNIACVVAQCPGLDGRASVLMASKMVGIGSGLRLIMHAQRDLVRSFLRLSPHKIPIVGKPGTIAMAPILEAYEAYRELARESFINEGCARILIRGDKYRPITHAKKVRCPVLLQICDHDTMTPIGATEKTAKILGKYAEVKRYPIAHFDIYTGDNFEKSVSDQLNFFKRHL
jgi:dienelactone hydrolase